MQVLQAIATAKRLGGIVYGFDVRKIAREQVESLGAEFLEIEGSEDLENKSGYAKEASEEQQVKQQQLINKYCQKCDIIITTALIPNKTAPILITHDTVNGMKPGSVIVDLATSAGGNCIKSVINKIISSNDITIIGYEDLASHVPSTASFLLANNYYNFFSYIFFSPRRDYIFK